MGQIRECTVCARRMYSTSVKNIICQPRAQRNKPCDGVMRIISIEERPRYRYRMDGTKLGEFW